MKIHCLNIIGIGTKSNKYSPREIITLKSFLEVKWSKQLMLSHCNFQLKKFCLPRHSSSLLRIQQFLFLEHVFIFWEIKTATWKTKWKFLKEKKKVVTFVQIEYFSSNISKILSVIKVIFRKYEIKKKDLF